MALKFPMASMPVEAATPVNAVAASIETALTGNNNDLVFTAKTKGGAGNSTTVIYHDPGSDGTINVDVVGKIITVRLAYATSAITSTASNVKAAVDAHPTASALVSVANADGNDGSGVVTAWNDDPEVTLVPLAGGIDGTPGRVGEVCADDTYLYICVAENQAPGTNWRRVALGSVY